jgi:hypothetical protein
MIPSTMSLENMFLKLFNNIPVAPEIRFDGTEVAGTASTRLAVFAMFGCLF